MWSGPQAQRVSTNVVVDKTADPAMAIYAGIPGCNVP